MMSEENKTKVEEQDLENPTSEKEEQVSESPKEKENICEKYNLKELCNVW